MRSGASPAVSDTDAEASRDRASVRSFAEAITTGPMASMPTIANAAMFAAPADRRGGHSGSASTLRQIGAVAGVACAANLGTPGGLASACLVVAVATLASPAIGSDTGMRPWRASGNADARGQLTVLVTAYDRSR